MKWNVFRLFWRTRSFLYFSAARRPASQTCIISSVRARLLTPLLDSREGKVLLQCAYSNFGPAGRPAPPPPLPQPARHGPTELRFARTFLPFVCLHGAKTYTLNFWRYSELARPDPLTGKNKVHGKNGFVTATKLGTTNEFFVALTKNFAAATKRFVDRTKHFVVVKKKYFCYPYFNKWLCWYNKTYFSVYSKTRAIFWVCLTHNRPENLEWNIKLKKNWKVFSLLNYEILSI